MSAPYYDWIAHHAVNRPEKVALIDLQAGLRLDYRALEDRVARFTGLLADRGVGRGDRVAILAQSCAEVFELQFACGRLGAIFVPLNWRLTQPELEFVIGNADPALLLYGEDFAETVEGLAIEGCAKLALDADFAKARAAARPRAPEPVMLDDVSTIIYTSGTTGRPKGALITHGMTFWNIVNLSGPALLNGDMVMLTVLPLFHTAGLNCYANPAFHAGGTVLLARGFDPGATLRMMSDRSIGITHFLGVPSHYQFMAQHPDFAAADLSGLVRAGCGGAPIPLSLLKQWEEKGVPLLQGFGMTETSPSVLSLDHADAASRIGSVGRPLQHLEARIVDEDGRDCADDEAGELWVRGPVVTPGYWRNPEASASAFRDGWFRTGDIARRNAEGYHYIVDRRTDMFISGGENVYPAEVENVLHQIEAIREAAVIGVPDARWGESGRAIVVVKPDHALKADVVLDHCRARLAKYKLPRDIVFAEALPRNATGKVLKAELRARYSGALPC